METDGGGSMWRMSTWIVSAATVGLCALPLVGQRTWIVDSANGPGAHFRDIDDAYAASGVGDTILVRPGNGLPYDLPPRIVRSIRIVAPGALPVPVQQTCSILNIPPSDIVVLDNMDFATLGSGARLPILQARGLVILSRMHASPYALAAAGFAEDSERVVFLRFRNHVAFGTSIIALNSNVWLLDSDIRSDYGIQSPLLINGGAFFGGTVTQRRAAWIIGTRIEGGTAHPGGGARMDWGISVRVCDVFVAGRSTILGGWYGFPSGACSSNPASMRHWSVLQQSALPPDPRASRFVRDPNTMLDNCTWLQGHEFVREIPAVLPGEAIRGQPQSILVHGPTSSIVSVFASFVHGAPPIELPVGDVWLDPNLVVHVATGPVDTDRMATMHTNIPSWLALGDVLVYQAVSLSQQSLWEISQPGFAVVRDP